MRRYVPDDEARALADQRARRQTAALGTLPRVSFDTNGMRRRQQLAARAADPTSILDDAPGESWAEWADSCFDVAFTVTTGWVPASGYVDLQIAWRRAISTFTAVAADVRNLATVLDAGQEEQAARRERAEWLNVRRHGAAAVCPRHGPTRGGLCRGCSRLA